MPSSRRCSLALIFLCLVSASGNAADDSHAWSVERFAADGSALFKAAAAAVSKPGTDVLVLDDEETYVFDADGKSTFTRYVAYKVLTQRGADGWDSISTQWEPWHQEHPAVRARVITPDGVVHVLDPKTISDAPAKDEDDSTYGDSRVLRAPLPAIAPGSIVEEEEITKETAPFFGAGVVTRSYFGRNVPVQFSRLAIDAPTSLPLRYSTDLLPDMKPVKTESNGRVHIQFDQGPVDALERADNYLPMETPANPMITFATGASWQSVAEGYGKIVDEKISVKDVQPLVSTLIAGKTTTDTKIAAIIQYLSREIRYTGVEFGDAAIVPHTPAETLKRKYGDCKDKATLAVTMLRAAGIPAYLALLNAGSRQDVPTDLPGMGLFDHAIVYVPGPPDIWIDATSEYARLGQLPSMDQGRFALVARAESNTLIRIPEASSQENKVVERREFYLAENGGARVVEISEPAGVFESQYRSSYADEDNKETKKKFQEYMNGQYLSEKLGPVKMSKPGDLSKPYQLTLEVTAAKRGFTNLDSAIAAIRLEGLFYWLPAELQQREKPEDKNDEAAKDKPKKPRSADWLLPEAFVCEWQYKITPPLGYQAKPVPPNQKIPVGPALLSQEYSLDADGSVRALIRFDTVKRRYSVAEATALRDKIEDLRGGQAIFIYFEPTAQALLNAGKSREAFQETRSLIAQHPKEAVHHLQRAKALLAGGMGQAARDEARQATKLEPTSALAQKTLAEILEFDLVGRQFRAGSDYPGAAAAFREAIKLDPDDKELVGNLAILLEYNDHGERYGPGAKLPQAIEEYQSLKEEGLAKIGLQNNLAYALFYAGKFAEAKQAAESVNPQLNGIIVASEAVLHGTDAGLAEAHKRTGNEADFQTVAKTAGDLLMRSRHYPQAGALMAAGASGSNASATMGLAAMLKRAQLHEDVHPENTPTGIVSKQFLVLLDPDLTLDKLAVIYSRNAQKVLRAAEVDTASDPVRAGRQLRSSLSRSGYSADVMLDVVFGALPMQSEGDDATGYRVSMTPPGSAKISFFVVKEDGKYLILDSSDKPNSVGLEILDRLQAQNTAGARILLDWIRDTQHIAGGDDPLSGYAFPRMWTKGKDADVELMKLAAAALCAQSAETAAAGVSILETGRSKSTDDAEKLNLAIALLTAYANLNDYPKLFALSSEVAKKYPESKRVFFNEQSALVGLGRFAEADQLAQDMSKRLPDDPEITRSFERIAVAREDYKLAHELGRKMVDSGKAEASDLNGVAWNSLFIGVVQPQDLEDGTKSAQLSQNSANVLHTLACVYAEMGKTKEARELAIQAMDILSLDEPDPNYWYAFGRIAEQYGENAIAIADYQQVKKPKLSVQIPGSSYRLAQIRLAVLHGAPPQKGAD